MISSSSSDSSWFKLSLMTLVSCLNLSRNFLGSLDAFPSDMRQLLVLDVSYNRIRSISRDTLRHLTKLVRLDLKGNLLSQVMPEVLRPLEAIKALDLAHNAFSVLPLDSIRAIEYTLQTINLEGKKNRLQNYTHSPELNFIQMT